MCNREQHGEDVQSGRCTERRFLISARRLQFEGKALAQLTAPGKPKPRVAGPSRIGSLVGVVVALSLVLLLTGAISVGSGFFGSERRAVGRLAATLLQGLAARDGELTLSVCAESATGARLLHEEERRLWREEPPPRLPGDEAAAARAATLEAIRTGLERAGVDWRDVTPLAFGRVRARVLDARVMQGPVTALTGNIFFESGGRVFTLELSAWRCSGEYVVVDIWRGAPVSLPREALQAVSADQFRIFEQEPSEDDNGLAVEFPRQVFFEF